MPAATDIQPACITGLVCVESALAERGELLAVVDEQRFYAASFAGEECVLVEIGRDDTAVWAAPALAGRILDHLVAEQSAWRADDGRAPMTADEAREWLERYGDCRGAQLMRHIAGLSAFEQG